VRRCLRPLRGLRPSFRAIKDRHEQGFFYKVSSTQSTAMTAIYDTYTYFIRVLRYIRRLVEHVFEAGPAVSTVSTNPPVFQPTLVLLEDMPTEEDTEEPQVPGNDVQSEEAAWFSAPHMRFSTI
jgi:hypothetical protein